MFQQAVTRLTLWYLLVIALLSASFSFALYNVSTHELNALQHRQENLTRAIPANRLPYGFAEFNQQRLQQIEDSKRHIAINLFYFNCIIIVTGGALSYFLAKRTLQPIEQSVEAQNRFTADASHELRTPLTAMRTEIEVALRSKDFSLSESKELHQSTLEEIAKLESLTNSLLKLSKQDNLTQQAAFDSCSLSVIIEDAIKHVSALAKQKQITVKTDSQDGLVQGDQWGLTELVSILLDNAIKYSPEKSLVEVVASIDQHQAAITIKDQGIGIKASDLPFIFDRFYRADLSRTKTDCHGYGLGLSLAKKIADTHHGTIEVRSTPGQGSIFTIHIPLKQASSTIRKKQHGDL